MRVVDSIPCIGLNGGPAFRHSEAFSFQIATDDQAGPGHRVRRQSVAQFYGECFGLPVRVMGHGNDEFSTAEFAWHLKERNKEDLVAGLIFSAARTSSNFGAARSTCRRPLLRADRPGAEPSPAGSWPSATIGLQGAMKMQAIRLKPDLPGIPSRRVQRA